MKKIVVTIMFLGLAVITYAAGQKDSSGRIYESYDDTGQVKSAEATLSGTAGLASTVTIPAWAKGFRLYPRTNHIRFYVDTSTVSSIGIVGTATAGVAVTTDTITKGGIAKADMWETRLLPCSGGSSGCTQRYLYLNSTTASVVIDVEMFGREGN